MRPRRAAGRPPAVSLPADRPLAPRADLLARPQGSLAALVVAQGHVGPVAAQGPHESESQPLAATGHERYSTLELAGRGDVQSLGIIHPVRSRAQASPRKRTPTWVRGSSSGRTTRQTTARTR